MKLYDVAEAICDSAASEWFETNTASTEAVQDYAENGMKLSITTDQARKILEAINNFKANAEPFSTHDRYTLLERPLDEEI